jgi:hypothetical protein
MPSACAPGTWAVAVAVAAAVKVALARATSVSTCGGSVATPAAHATSISCSAPSISARSFASRCCAAMQRPPSPRGLVSAMASKRSSTQIGAAITIPASCIVLNCRPASLVQRKLLGAREPKPVHTGRESSPWQVSPRDRPALQDATGSFRLCSFEVQAAETWHLRTNPLLESARSIGSKRGNNGTSDGLRRSPIASPIASYGRAVMADLPFSPHSWFSTKGHFATLTLK